MATKKKSTSKKSASKKKANLWENMVCKCDNSWEKNAWMVIFGIAIGICVGFVLGVTQY